LQLSPRWRALKRRAPLLNTKGVNLPDAQQSKDSPERARAFRIAYNSPIQGAGADICTVSLERCRRAFEALGLRSVPILQIHDAVIFDVHKDEIDIVRPLVRKVMCKPYPWMRGVPLEVDYHEGATWGHIEEKAS